VDVDAVAQGAAYHSSAEVVAVAEVVASAAAVLRRFSPAHLWSA
jgi:hypothetical protein